MCYIVIYKKSYQFLFCSWFYVQKDSGLLKTKTMVVFSFGNVNHNNWCFVVLLFTFQDLENQMHIAEQRRRTLLKDFHDTWSNGKAPASPSFLSSFFTSLPLEVPLLPSMTIFRCSHTAPFFSASLHSLICVLLSVFPSFHSHNAAGSQNGMIVSPLPLLIFILTSCFGLRASFAVVTLVAFQIWS